MGIYESASTVRFGWSDEGVTTSTSRVAGRNTLLQWFESIYQSPAVLVKTESTPPWVPTNRFALSLEEIGYGHQQLTRMKTGTVGLLPELDKRNQQSSAVLVVQRVSAVVALLSL